MPARRLSLALALIVSLAASNASAAYKVGTARIDITPKTSMWMAGYGSRTGPSEGVEHPLWAKALVIEDEAKGRSVIVSLDICGIGSDLSNPIRDTLRSKYGLERKSVVLACSHTHCGPVVGGNLISMYKMSEAQYAQVREYATFLSGAIVDVVGEALGKLSTGTVAWGTGKCDFGVNRRENKEPEVPELRAKLELKGPVDHDVPVLQIKGEDGSLKAVVFGYACHCTVMSYQKFSGDYAGFAQIAIEKANPGAQAMFVAGCGADQNPLPRRTLDKAQLYGTMLADAVQATLSGPLTAVSGPIGQAYEEIPLKFASIPSKEEIEATAKSKDFYLSSRAKAQLQTIAKEGKIAETYDYPVQVWTLGKLRWIFLGGEVVVDYSLKFKRNLGSSTTWVSGYCNDVMAYIPSLRVLKEGGYEGATSMIYYGRPSPWAEPIEDEITASVRRLTK